MLKIRLKFKYILQENGRCWKSVILSGLIRFLQVLMIMETRNSVWFTYFVNKTDIEVHKNSTILQPQKSRLQWELILLRSNNDKKNEGRKILCSYIRIKGTNVSILTGFQENLAITILINWISNWLSIAYLWINQLENRFVRNPVISV